MLLSKHLKMEKQQTGSYSTTGYDQSIYNNTTWHILGFYVCTWITYKDKHLLTTEEN